MKEKQRERERKKKGYNDNKQKETTERRTKVIIHAWTKEQGKIQQPTEIPRE